MLSEAPGSAHPPDTCSLGVPTRHLDVRYGAVAPTTAQGTLPVPVCSDESMDLAWWPIDALPENIDAVSVPDLIDHGRAALQADGLLPR